jgi:hypothetical protein
MHSATRGSPARSPQGTTDRAPVRRRARKRTYEKIQENDAFFARGEGFVRARCRAGARSTCRWRFVMDRHLLQGREGEVADQERGADQKTAVARNLAQPSRQMCGTNPTHPAGSALTPVSDPSGEDPDRARACAGPHESRPTTSQNVPRSAPHPTARLAQVALLPNDTECRATSASARWDIARSLASKPGAHLARDFRAKRLSVQPPLLSQLACYDCRWMWIAPARARRRQATEDTAP